MRQENSKKRQSQQTVQALTAQVQELDSTVDELQAQLAAMQHQCLKIETFQDGKYTDNFRQCCISLLAQNVGVHHINNVITDVLKLTNATANCLPISTLLKQMLLEGCAISLMQIGEAAAMDNNTLHYDGTSKFGKNMEAFN